jgi:hypothetical protein
MDIKNMIIIDKINKVPFAITEKPNGGGIILVTRENNLLGCGANSLMEFLSDHSADLPHFDTQTGRIISIPDKSNFTVGRLAELISE